MSASLQALDLWDQALSAFVPSVKGNGLADRPVSMCSFVNGLGQSGEIDSDLSCPSIPSDLFSGSIVNFLKDGSSTIVVGSDPNGTVAGVFSGSQAAARVPDEAGGVSTLIGDDSTLIGGFVVD